MIVLVNKRIPLFYMTTTEICPYALYWIFCCHPATGFNLVKVNINILLAMV